jgi:hypothetical protein
METPHERPGQLPNVVFEVGEGLVGPAQLGATKREPEELDCVGLDHPTLGLVDHQLDAGGQEPHDAGFDPCTGSLAPDQDKQVIGVAREAMPVPLQLLVEVVQQDVCQQRAETESYRRDRL